MKTAEEWASRLIEEVHASALVVHAVELVAAIQSDARKDLEQEVEELKREMETLEGWLASEIGIEEGERNAGDDPSKRYWIGADNQVYESRRQAINNAMKEEK